MDDKTLADKVVALGVGVVMRRPEHGDIYGREVAEFTADYFVRDPRVAMALMERCDSLYWEHDEFGYQVQAWPDESQLCPVSTEGDSLPRAIVEACCLALEES